MTTPLSLKTLMWVALGGALGAMLRVILGEFTHGFFHENSPMSFPFSIVIVNIIGSMYLGLVAALVEQGIWQPRQLWIQGSGIAGALTTFSAMAAVAVEFWLNQNYLALVSFLLVQLIVGLVFCYLAMRLVVYIYLNFKRE
ncbi:MAG TPA: CrcB family protein [Aliidiomarina sp.]|nr:CrcB family protein [Aliidiomarina sp.]